MVPFPVFNCCLWSTTRDELYKFWRNDIKYQNVRKSRLVIHSNWHNFEIENCLKFELRLVFESFLWSYILFFMTINFLLHAIASHKKCFHASIVFLFLTTFPFLSLGSFVSYWNTCEACICRKITKFHSFLSWIWMIILMPKTQRMKKSRSFKANSQLASLMLSSEHLQKNMKV